jgi:hypothetical protein
MLVVPAAEAEQATTGDGGRLDVHRDLHEAGSTATATPDETSNRKGT